MTIQWFPGHMTRAKRQIEEKLKLIDIACELLDARIPWSSRNPMIDEILRGKPRLILLNKSDLADPAIVSEWLAFFAERQFSALAIDSASGYQVKNIAAKAKELLAEKIQAQIRRGLNPRAIRALIIGIPNVGKSTLINRLAGKHVAATGDRPGITKGQQWIRMGEMELLDTPGVLWPKFADPNVGYRLAMTGAIRDEILPAQDVAFFAVRYFLTHYRQRLQDRYALEEMPDLIEEAGDVVHIMEEIGRKRGCLRSGGAVDFDKTAMVILNDVRAGKLGKICLERPSEVTVRE